MFGDTPAGWPSVSAQVAGGSTSHRSLMVSEAAPGVPPRAWPPAITESVSVSSSSGYALGMMMGGLFSSRTSEHIRPRFSPYTQGGIGSGAGDVEGKGRRTEPCSMSQKGEGVEIVKWVGVGEVTSHD